jgi:hypothetical protein
MMNTPGCGSDLARRVVAYGHDEGAHAVDAAGRVRLVGHLVEVLIALDLEVRRHHLQHGVIAMVEALYTDGRPMRPKVL